jgi:hypothetical protein
MSVNELSRQIHGHHGMVVRLGIDSGGHRYNVSMTTSCLLCPEDASLKMVHAK